MNQSAVQPMRRKKPKKEWKLLFLALPFIAYILVFCYVPLVGWSYAFIDYQLGRSPWTSQFVGLYYFKMMFSSLTSFRLVLRNTLIFNILGYLVSWMPMALAIMLSELKSPWFKKTVQTATTFPNFISWVLVYSMVFAMISNDGVVNMWLKNLGLIKESLSPLTNADLVWYLQTALGVWKSVGFGSIIYLAAIAGIDTQLYDAAKVDGAGRMRCIWHITIPGILPTYIVLLILSISNLFASGFDQNYVFNNALVSVNMENLAMYTYSLYSNADYSYGIAVGMMQSLVGVIMLVIANELARLIKGYRLF